MSTNQTIDGVPRDRLELCVKALASTGYTFESNELRALLDADKCTSCDGSGEYIDAIGDWRGYCVCPAGIALENKPAAQPQGEPVAWLNVATGHVTTSAVVVMDWDDEKEQVKSLYAEPPAPVAVVMPERKCERKLGQALMENYRSGWNACIDEVTRLNTKE